MKIQAINNTTSFGKIGKAGKIYGRAKKAKTMTPVPAGQTAKVETWYQNQVSSLCATETNQETLNKALKDLYNEYLNKLDAILR